MAVRGFEGHAIEGLELFDLFQGLRREGRFAFEGVEDDAFDEIAEGHVFLLGDCFEDLEHTFFEANAGLDALDFDGGVVLFFLCHVYQCTKVHRCAQEKIKCEAAYWPCGVTKLEGSGEEANGRSSDLCRGATPKQMKMRLVGIVLSHLSKAWMGHPWFMLVSEFSGQIL